MTRNQNPEAEQAAEPEAVEAPAEQVSVLLRASTMGAHAGATVPVDQEVADTLVAQGHAYLVEQTATEPDA